MPGSKKAGPASRSTLNRCQSGSDQHSIADILTILHKWGIHTLGQFATLDKEELRARLGPVAVSLWEKAAGQANRLLKFVQPPESFEENFEFEHEIETAEPLLFMLRRFLEQLALRLSALYLVAQELTLRITFSKGSYEHVFKIPQPTNDVDLLFRMLQTHLENFKSEHPIVAVALIAQPIKPVSQQFGLFQTALRNPHQLYETLARLTALLGDDRVGTPVLEETHRPDAFRMERFGWHGLPAKEASPAGTIDRMPMPRPVLRRFRPSASASFFISEAARGTQVQRHLQTEKICGKIADRSGPYLLSGNWWDEKSWQRAEWDMQLENGELIRVHEDPPSQNSSPVEDSPWRARTWKIDGIYD